MFPGPVFAVELLTTARRSRYYALRTLYGMLLLMVLWVSYREFVESHGEGQMLFAPNEMSVFAKRTFLFFAVVQGLLVFAITPALVGGTIASEKQRKTLHYLLASELTSSEIVFGKLFARMLIVFVYMLAGIPFLFMMRFFGGIDASLILIDFVVTACFAFFLASMSIFYSTIMKQARSAIIASYMTIITIAFLPLIAQILSMIFYDRINWVSDVIAWVSPLINIFEINVLVTGSVVSSVTRMVIAQAIYSSLFLCYSTWRLRSIAANQTNKPRLILRLDKRGRPSWRALPRPAISTDPMMWKERYTSRVGGWAKMLGLLNNLFWATLIGCFTFDYGRTAILEMIRAGMTDQAVNGSNRQDFLNVIKWLSPFIAGFWILGTATTAASSIASEREDDTWLSLIATDLGGREILRAKMLGSILRFRWIGIMLVTVWAFGLIAGAMHPLSFVFAIFEMVIFLGFASALGMRFSLTSSSTSRALMLTLTVLIFMNGGYLLCCIPIPSFQVNAGFACVMPWVIARSLFSSETLAQYDAFIASPTTNNLNEWDRWSILPTSVGIAIYGSLMVVMIWRSYALFDLVADRPRASFDVTPPHPDEPHSQGNGLDS